MRLKNYCKLTTSAPLKVPELEIAVLSTAANRFNMKYNGTKNKGRAQ